jgi:hypothetical protein
MVLPAAAGAVLGGAFGAVALMRRGKPLHPKGVVLDAVLRRTGAGGRWESAWLDEPGADRGLTRLSRAVGLPAGVPDVLGLALTFGAPGGPRHDLLLASTGLGRVGRFVLVPRRDPAGARYTSLFPYRSARGPVVLAAVPVPLRRTGPAGSLVFRLLAARPRGRWREFGRLELTVRTGDEPDLPVRFDPILNPLPGLGWYPALARLREPAYAAARRRPLWTSVRAIDRHRTVGA